MFLYIIGMLMAFVMSYIWFILSLIVLYDTYDERIEKYYDTFEFNGYKMIMLFCTLLSWVGCGLITVAYVVIFIIYICKIEKNINYITSYKKKIIKKHNKCINYLFKFKN